MCLHQIAILGHADGISKGGSLDERDSRMSQSPLKLAEAPERREVLRQALADAIYYRDPPVSCPACPLPDELCEECADGLARARKYLALSRALGLEMTS
jgi:hypothetical protein